METFADTLEIELAEALEVYRQSDAYPKVSRATRIYLARTHRALRAYEASCLRWGVT